MCVRVLEAARVYVYVYVSVSVCYVLVDLCVSVYVSLLVRVSMCERL